MSFREVRPAWSVIGVVCVPLQSAECDSPWKASTSTASVSIKSLLDSSGKKVPQYFDGETGLRSS